MKHVTRFEINTISIMLTTLLFNVIAYEDWSHVCLRPKTPFVGFLTDVFPRIQSYWCLHMCGIAIITIIATLLKIKKVDPWEYSCKIMWLSFWAITFIHCCGIVTGWMLYLV